MLNWNVLVGLNLNQGNLFKSERNDLDETKSVRFGANLQLHGVTSHIFLPGVTSTGSSVETKIPLQKKAPNHFF